MLFIADTGNNTIRKVDPEENSVTSFAGYGIAGMEDADGPNASFNEPVGICFDARMNMYVADTRGSSIRKIVFTPLGSTTPTRTRSSNLPGIPQQLELSATLGSGSVALTWVAPTSIIPIQGYILEYGIAPQSDFISTNSPQTSYTVSNLVGNTQYTFRVKAVNAFGSGEYSAAQTITIGRLSVTITLANTSSYDDIIVFPTILTMPLASYEVTYKDASMNTIFSPSQIGKYTGLVVVDTPVYDGAQSFDFEIKSAKPSEPTNVYAIAYNAQAIVRWNAPVSKGRYDIDYYTVVSDPGAVSVTTASGSIRTATVPGLTNGTSYTFTVAAHNLRGMGPTTRTASSIVPIGPPSAPTNVRTSRNMLGVVTLAWSTPLYTNGSPVTLYTIEPLPQNNAMNTIFVVPGDVYEYTFLTGVTAGVNYKFRVTAYNLAGAGGSAETTSFVNPNTIPDRPVVSIQAGDRSAIVSWTMPANTGILEYTVTVHPSNRILKPGLSTSVTISDLNNGTAYSFRVYATNAIGNGLVGFIRYTTIPFPLTPNTSQLTLPKWYTMGRN